MRAIGNDQLIPDVEPGLWMTYDLGYAPGYAREGISWHVQVMCMYSSPDSSILFAYAVRLDPEAEV